MKRNRKKFSIFSAETLDSLAMAEVVGGVSVAENTKVCNNIQNCGGTTNTGICTNADCSTDCDCPIDANICPQNPDCTVINKADNCVCK